MPCSGFNSSPCFQRRKSSCSGSRKSYMPPSIRSRNHRGSKRQTHGRHSGSEESRQKNPLCVCAGEVSTGKQILSSGHGSQRHQKDQWVQYRMQILLQLWRPLKKDGESQYMTVPAIRSLQGTFISAARKASGSLPVISDYGIKLARTPFEGFLPILRYDSFQFLEEEELPARYKAGELFF